MITHFQLEGLSLYSQFSGLGDEKGRKDANKGKYSVAVQVLRFSSCPFSRYTSSPRSIPENISLLYSFRLWERRKGVCIWDPFFGSPWFFLLILSLVGWLGTRRIFMKVFEEGAET